MDLTNNELRKKIEELEKEISTLKSSTSFVSKLSQIDVDLSNANLNEKIGSFIVGYGNDLVNAASGISSGYFINISHVWVSLRKLYNKQFLVPRQSNEIHVRTQENGIWSSWTKI